MDDYLSKPAPLRQLQAVLEKWLPAAGDTRPEEHKMAAAAAVSSAPIEAGVLAGLIGDDDEAIGRILGVFGNSLPASADELRSACTARDAKRVLAAAHRLKSSARSTGALRLGDCCAEFERAARADATGRFSGLLDQFNSELAAVQAQLAEEST
jgi:HPt (histidine-containing phosphotransfer) domain-containing protein